MTLTKEGYIDSPKKLTKVTRDTAKKALEREIDRLTTPEIIWFLTKRHKFGLMALSNIGLIALLVFQFIERGV